MEFTLEPDASGNNFQWQCRIHEKSESRLHAHSLQDNRRRFAKPLPEQTREMRRTSIGHLTQFLHVDSSLQVVVQKLTRLRYRIESDCPGVYLVPHPVEKQLKNPIPLQFLFPCQRRGKIAHPVTQQEKTPVCIVQVNGGRRRPASKPLHNE